MSESEVPIDREEPAAEPAGESARFESLVKGHRGRVFALAARMLGSEADAAEVTQEAFLSAYRNFSTFRSEAFGAWVSRTAANHALMRLRRRRLAAEVEEPLEDLAAWGRDLEAMALDAELRQAIDEAAEALPGPYREVFSLRDLDGLSYQEIAGVVGESVPAIKSRLHRARLALRAALGEFSSS